MIANKINFNQGFTLIELLVLVSLIGIVLAIGLPSFSDFQDRQKINGVGDNLHFLMKFARAEAAKQNTPMVVSFKGVETSDWCVGVSTATCDCGTENACLVDGTERILDSDDYSNVTFDSSTFPDSAEDGIKVVSISAARGRSVAGEVKFSLNGKDIRLIRSIVGRDRICSPSDTSLRYPAC